jgi:hypothetical protein
MGMSPGRRRASTAPVLDCLRTVAAPSPPALPDLEAWLIGAPQSADAQAQNGTPASRKAVSLRVQPDLVLALREALVLAGGIGAAFVHGSMAKGEQSAASEIELMMIGCDLCRLLQWLA